MAKLKDRLKAKKPFTKLFLTGIGGCLTGDQGQPLIVRIRPLSIKVIMQRQEMMSLIEGFKKANPTDTEHLEKEANRAIMAMSATEQLALVESVVEVGRSILRDYAADAGHSLSSDFGLNEAEVYEPIKFVETKADAEAWEEVNPDDTVIMTDCIGDNEYMQVVGLLKTIAQGLQSSKEPIIPIQNEEGGDELLISPNELNTFPASL